MKLELKGINESELNQVVAGSAAAICSTTLGDITINCQNSYTITRGSLALESPKLTVVV